jgi:hypothetical protein
MYLPQKTELSPHLETEYIAFQRRVLFYILKSTPASVEEKLSMPVEAGPVVYSEENSLNYSPFLTGEKPPFLALFWLYIRVPRSLM